MGSGAFSEGRASHANSIVEPDASLHTPSNVIAQPPSPPGINLNFHRQVTRLNFDQMMRAARLDARGQPPLSLSPEGVCLRFGALPFGFDLSLRCQRHQH